MMQYPARNAVHLDHFHVYRKRRNTLKLTHPMAGDGPHNCRNWAKHELHGLVSAKACATGQEKAEAFEAGPQRKSPPLPRSSAAISPWLEAAVIAAEVSGDNYRLINMGCPVGR